MMCPADSGGLELENGVSLRRRDSGIGDEHASVAPSEADASAGAGPDAISEALSTLSPEVRRGLDTAAEAKGKNVRDILRSLVSGPADDIVVDPSFLPPTFLDAVGGGTQSFRSFDRSDSHTGFDFGSLTCFSGFFTNPSLPLCFSLSLSLSLLCLSLSLFFLLSLSLLASPHPLSPFLFFSLPLPLHL